MAAHTPAINGMPMAIKPSTIRAMPSARNQPQLCLRAFNSAHANDIGDTGVAVDMAAVSLKGAMRCEALPLFIERRRLQVQSRLPDAGPGGDSLSWTRIPVTSKT